MNTGESSQLASVILSIILLATICVLSGCLYSHEEFQPIKLQQPLVMFDNYRVRVTYFAGTGRLIRIEVEFLNRVTNKSTTNAIPIFEIDSLCLSGECVVTDLCAPVMSWYELGLESERKGGGRGWYWKGFRDHDLYLIDGDVVPGGFAYVGPSLIPESCKDETLTMRLFARLVNRTDGHNIDASMREIHLRHRQWRRLEME